MRQRIRAAALDLISARGFHATSMRELAQAVGIEPASLYYHYASKQDLLHALFDQIMDDLLETLQQAERPGQPPRERLVAVVRAHVMFHIARRKEAFVSHSELRSLTAANRRLIVAKRDRYEAIVRSLLQSGVDDGQFRIEDIEVTATSLLVMCSGVADWIRPNGRLRPAAVADIYARLALRLVGLEVTSAD